MFSPLTSQRLAQAAALTNTSAGDRGGRPAPERLDSPERLAELFPEWGFDDSATSATLRNVRKLRSGLAGIWQDAADLDLEGALDGINSLLSVAGPIRVVAPLEPDEETAPAGQPAGAADLTEAEEEARTPAVLRAGRSNDTAEKSMSTSLALALAEVALAGELTRLRTCAGDGCENAFVDLTRNRSKQFCDEANCANRAHVKAYRARRAAEEAAEQEAAEAEDAEDAEEVTGPEEATDGTADDTDDSEDKKDKKSKSGKKKAKKKK